MSDAKNVLLFSEEVGNLKHTERRGWVLREIPSPERVTGHMYRMAMLAMTAVDSVEGCDMDKVVKMCLVHDLAECRVGDITPHCGVSKDDKHRMEREAMDSLSLLLGPTKGPALNSMYEEYEAHESKEAKLTKDLDCFDLLHQTFEYEKKLLKEHDYVPNLSEFFVKGNLMDKIDNPQIQSWVKEMTMQRNIFLQENKDKIEEQVRGPV